jgi:D-glycero-beta-D-manno-heptose 1-phosphate adenylyltransferase
MTNHWELTKSKLLSLEEALAITKTLKNQGKKIVFTNGCFDVLHLGHVSYLAKAASLGDCLVVALNTDASVRALNKAPNRPIHDEDARRLVIASLSCVDSVILFDENTPLNAIETLLPDVLVKGADYDAKEIDKASSRYIVGSDVVLKNGGEIATIEFVEGHSTTNILRK